MLPGLGREHKVGFYCLCWAGMSNIEAGFP